MDKRIGYVTELVLIRYGLEALRKNALQYGIRAKSLGSEQRYYGLCF